MRFDGIKIRNLGPFTDAELDISRLDGTLIQVAGPNGAGKTTLLELMCGALFRQCPTRGKLASLATSRDSSVEVRVRNGASYTVRQLVDAHSAKGESLILREDGTPVVESAKVSEASKWVAEHFPAPDLLYSSSVSVQGRRGMLDMSAGERKAVLLRALRIEHLEQRAEQARERARAAKAHLDTLRARAADLPWPELNVLTEQLAEARARVDIAAEGARVARAGLERARAASQDAARAAELAEQRRAAEGRLASARAQLADLEKRIGNNRALLARADEVNAAVKRAAELDAQIAAAKLALTEATNAHRAAVDAETTAAQERKRTRAAAEQEAEGVRRIEARLRDRDAVEKAVESLEGLRARAARHEAEIANGEADIARLEALVLNGKDRRIAGLRSELGVIALGDLDNAKQRARETLQDDDALAEKLADAPGELAASRAAVAVTRRALSDAQSEIVATERLAARAQEMAQADADLDRARTAEQKARDASCAALDACDRAAAVTAAAWKEVLARREPELLNGTERAKLDDLLKLAPVLAQASARIEELETQLPTVRASIAAAETELTGLPVINVERVDLAAQESAVAHAEAAEHQTRESCARAQAALERGQDVAAKRAVVEQEVKAAEAELSDWTRIAQDLGKDGIQALEIDAAIPELNTIANDLLHSCHGSRFTVELRAERTSADGKRQLEGLEIRVIDSERGRDALVETYSGGECVIVGEALALALTTVSCRAAGIENPTLLRDETGAALDEANGRAYSAMLRRCAQHIGADKVLVVCHGSWLVPDAVVMVGNGKVEVVS